jgi:hypothetical protein
VHPPEVLYLSEFGVRSDGTDQSARIRKLIIQARDEGISEVSFRGINASVSTIRLLGIRDLKLRGDGGKLRKLKGSGSNTTIFNLEDGCWNIEISGFADLDGGYGSSNASTGSNPIILIGDQTPAGRVGARNGNIVIRNNHLRRANWGAVVVYGRSAAGMTTPPLNRNIDIIGNVISDVGGSGIFVYKNASDVRVTDNQIVNVSSNGIVFDTRAATDPLPYSEPVRTIEISRNSVRSFGTQGQGIGILLKGAVQKASVIENWVGEASVHGRPGLVNYGIMINKDASARLTAPSEVILARNVTSRIRGSAGSVGLFVGPGATAVTLAGNTLDGCATYPMKIAAAPGRVSRQANQVTRC